tara:strand:+ start:440 stop:1210 length:771 start_codon:yes stop_codon:yes gene_type:complete
MENKILIVCAGDKSKFYVALTILKFLINKNKNKDKYVVVVLDKNKKILSFLKAKKIKFIANNFKFFFENVEKNQFDWLLNIWGPKIYKENFLKKFKSNLNLHPSYLPYARGKDPYFWSIYYQYPIGVSIHKMDSKIDHGKIFLRKKINLKFPFTAGEVFNRTLKSVRNEFIKNWDKIRNKRIKPKKIKLKNKLVHKRVDLIKRNFVDLNLSKNNIIRKFVLSCLGQDFSFLKMQIRLNKNIYDLKLNLNKTKKKIW